MHMHMSKETWIKLVVSSLILLLSSFLVMQLISVSVLHQIIKDIETERSLVDTAE